MRAAILTAALLALAATAAQAQTPHPLAEGGRYQLMDVNEKIVRLDTETGAFDLCRLEPGGWNCEMAEDERRALEVRVDELTARIDRLETALAAAAADEAAAQAQNEAQASRGLAARLYEYVPDIGW